MSFLPLPRGVPVAMAAVRWIDGHFYFVRLIGPEPGGYRIQFSDGDLQTVPATSVVTIPTQPTFRVGDHILAVWKTDRMFPGTVSSISNYGYTVAWHDGDAPLVVRPGMLTYLAWANAAIQVPPRETDPDWLDITDEVLEPATDATQTKSQPPSLPPVTDEPRRHTLHIFIPGTIMPVDRGIRFVEPLEEALGRANLGTVVDEGTKLVEVSGRPTVDGCWITVEVSDVERGLEIMRSALKGANAPSTTTITRDEPVRIVYGLQAD